MRYTPRAVNVMGKTVPVIQVPHLQHNEADCFGVYSPVGPTISLEREMGHERRCETLLHESLHAIFNATYLNALLGEHEEDLVSRLAPALLDFLRANRSAVEFLVAKQ